MHIQESGEMYLETILILSKRQPHVRSIDVGEYMGFSKPSVSRAIGLLKADGLIEVAPNGIITLTAKGRDLASNIYERHKVISDFLSKIGVDKNTAADDACRIEHVISEITFEKLKEHVNKI
jgi:Mn-dependent DtxR family transcriptional regulator